MLEMKEINSKDSLIILLRYYETSYIFTIASGVVVLQPSHSTPWLTVIQKRLLIPKEL